MSTLASFHEADRAYDRAATRAIEARHSAGYKPLAAEARRAAKKRRIILSAHETARAIALAEKSI